ncbi:MAG: F0F1 ATP synthase subunit gamma [Candidatus Saccharibacteria bacterium]
MSSLKDLQQEYEQYRVIGELSEALEGIASYRIRQIKDRVLLSKEFFQQLYAIYQGLRVEKDTVRSPSINRDLYIVLTSTGGLSGEIDDQIVRQVVKDYTASTTDIITIGAHGSALLSVRGIRPVRAFGQPDITKPIDTSPIVEVAQKYRRTYVYYQEFQTLTLQRPARIELVLETQRIESELPDSTAKTENLIIANEYLFEPTQEEVIAYLENVMLSITMTQLIFESQLAQFAARFTAMLTANSRATDAQQETRMRYLAARRRERDEAAHEIVYAMRGAR